MNFANEEAREKSNEPENWLLTIHMLEEKRCRKNRAEYVKAKAAQVLTPFAVRKLLAPKGPKERIQGYYGRCEDDNRTIEKVIQEAITGVQEIKLSVQVWPVSDDSERARARMVTFRGQLDGDVDDVFQHHGISCDCGVPSATGIPCGHVVKARSCLPSKLQEFAGDSKLCHSYFSLESWGLHTVERGTRRISRVLANQLPIDLEADQIYLPPLRGPKSGRPKMSQRHRSVLKDFIAKVKKARKTNDHQVLRALPLAWRNLPDLGFTPRFDPEMDEGVEEVDDAADAGARGDLLETSSQGSVECLLEAADGVDFAHGYFSPDECSDDETDAHLLEGANIAEGR